MMDWGGLMWGLFSLFVLLLVGGLVVGAWALARRFGGSGSATRILDERLARGDISPEEYRERLRVLGGGSRTSRVLTPFVVGLIAVGLVGGVAVTAVGSGGFMHHMMGMGSMMAAGPTERSAPEPVPGAPDVQVVGTEFSFSPAEIQLNPGETVNLVFANRGHMFHTLTIGEVGFELRAGGGDSIAGALRLNRPGTYSFICAVPGHAEAGMRATITVG